MKSLFEAGAAGEILDRIGRLRPDTPRRWGKMDPAQMLAHCARAMETATGDAKPPRMFIGRILGPLVRPQFYNDKPFPRNSPTGPSLRITDPQAFESEKAKLIALVGRFSRGGGTACTRHPHTFFGPLRPDQWAMAMFKHLDHHLRQFGV